MIKPYVALLALTLSISAAPEHLFAQSTTPTHSLTENQASDQATIEKIMADLHVAVVAHDGKRVTSLSVAEGSTWFNVLSDKAFAAAKQKSQTVQKVCHSSFADFAKFVSSTPAALNSQHTHVQIHTDGTIANVYFDYVFLVDRKAQNQGCETWQMIKHRKDGGLLRSRTPRILLSENTSKEWVTLIENSGFLRQKTGTGHRCLLSSSVNQDV